MTAEDVQAIGQSQLGALLIPGILPAPVIQRATRNLLNHFEPFYPWSTPGIGHLGLYPRLLEIMGEGEEYWKSKYFDDRDSVMDARSSCFQAGFFPVDILRDSLSRCHRAGVEFFEVQDKRCSAGHCSILSNAVMAHQDKLEENLFTDRLALNLVGQMEAMIFLKVSERGGIFKLWNCELPHESYRRFLGRYGGYGIPEPERLFGQPAVSYKPKSGDMFIFNPRNLHAFTEGEGGENIFVTVSIADQGPSVPLKLYS